MARHRQNFTDGDGNLRFFPPGGALFNPASLVGTQGGFWRADVGVTQSSGNVSAWADQSAHGNTLTVLATPQAQTAPFWSATGFNTSFAGVSIGASVSTDGVGKTSSIVQSTTLSLFMLFSDNTGGGARLISSFSSSQSADYLTPGYDVGLRGSGSISIESGGNRGNGGSAVSFSENTPVVFGIIADGANVNAYKNFAVQGSASAFSSALGDATAGSAFSVGFANYQNTTTGNFKLAYVLLTNTALVAGDLTNLKNWTNSNWGTAF